jgi:SagB-type dehydrogenase family enzyme
MVELPLVPDDGTPPYDSLFHSKEPPPQPLTAESLGLFLELSLGLTAWKEFEDTRWALRSNPSSGNLHPTEGYVVLPPLASLSDRGGVYHYAPREHALEHRCILNKSATGTLGAVLPASAFLVGLTSVHWREAWKYGARAYRYCQHDVGHALGALCIAAAALGWHVALVSTLSDTEVAGLLGVDRTSDFKDAEAEHPDLIATVITDPANAVPPHLTVDLVAGVRTSNWTGKANRLSPDHVDWAEIAAVEDATVKPHTESLPLRDVVVSSNPALQPIRDLPRSAAIIRQRRSAVVMDARTGLSLDAFFGMLARTHPDRPHPPWSTLDFPPRIHLCLFVHRIDGLTPGLYVLVRDEARLDAFRAACHDQFTWSRVESSGMPFYALDLGDCRETAAQASCGQAIAGDSAFSLGMIADFGRTLEEDGAWAYRRLFWEAGLIGQVLYLEAEAAGVRSTGMGCYFDDVVHQILGIDLSDDAWQSLYHFTVGGAVDDLRLTTLPAYGHLPPERTSLGRSGI